MRLHQLTIASAAIFAIAASAFGAQSDLQNRGLLATAIYNTAIHVRPDGNSPTYYKVPKDMRLVVREGGSGYWRQVLLTTGAFGYVPADALQVYPQEYDIKRSGAPRAGMPLTSRGGSRNTNLSYGAKESVAAANAQNFLGIPYKWGGNDTTGIDCSGLVKKLYGEVGVDLPRTAAEQALVGTPITRLEYLRPGDRLYFWEAKRGKIGHTGIYEGGGYFIHASHGHGEVARDYLGDQKWLRILVAARRS
jgi:cell wall-associated NlpC family hydrolase